MAEVRWRAWRRGLPARVVTVSAPSWFLARDKAAAELGEGRDGLVMEPEEAMASNLAPPPAVRKKRSR